MQVEKILRTEEEVREFLKGFNSKCFAFDTETNETLRQTEFNLSEPTYKNGISLCDGVKSCYISNDKGVLDKIYKDLCDVFNKAEYLIGHNIAFDIRVLKSFNIEVPESTELYCTMVGDHLLDENRPHSLKYLSRTLLGKDVTLYEDAIETQEVFEKYALNDAIWTWELMQWQKPRLLEQSLMPLFVEIEMPFQRVLVDMAINGVLVDDIKIISTTKKLRKEVENLLVQMLECIEEKYELQLDLFNNSTIVSNINFNSTQDLADILFNRLKLKPVEYTPSGSISVGKKTIEALRDKHKFITLLEKYKIAQKLLNGFFIPMPKFIEKDNRIRPNFRDTGTKTGRLSCNNPNLQQLPKPNKIFPINTRECFIVPEGYKMLTCDYSGQELRVLTQLTQEPALIETFIKGKDMHLSTANDFFELGIPEEELLDSNPMRNKHKKRYKDERDKAKIINFGMAYGKGAYGFSKDFGISEPEAQKILDKYFAALPKVKEAIDKCHSDVKRKGFVTSMATRRRRFQPKEGTTYYPNSAFRQSFNFLIQGFSADMIRKAAIDVREEAKKYPEWDLKAIATVHDEVVYEVKEEFTEPASKIIKKAFEEAVDFVIPVVADVDVGDNYGEAK